MSSDVFASLLPRPAARMTACFGVSSANERRRLAFVSSNMEMPHPLRAHSRPIYIKFLNPEILRPEPRRTTPARNASGPVGPAPMSIIAPDRLLGKIFFKPSTTSSRNLCSVESRISLGWWGKCPPNAAICLRQIRVAPLASPPGPLSSVEGEKRVTRGLVSKSHRAINQIPEGGYKKGDPLGRP